MLQVSVLGVPVTYDYMFEEQFFEYVETAPVRRLQEEMTSEDDVAKDGSERRSLVSFGDTKEATVPGGEFPLQITTTLSFNIGVGARFTRKYWRLWGRGWFNWDPCKCAGCQNVLGFLALMYKDTSILTLCSIDLAIQPSCGYVSDCNRGVLKIRVETLKGHCLTKTLLPTLSNYSIVRAGWGMSISLSQSYSIKLSDIPLVSIEKNFFPKIPIPNAGFSLPSIIGNALNKILPSGIRLNPEAGLFVVSSNAAVMGMPGNINSHTSSDCR